MAESEGRGCDLMDEVNSPSANSDDVVKFKDPLLTGLDRDSDDDGVSILAARGLRSHCLRSLIIQYPLVCCGHFDLCINYHSAKGCNLYYSQSSVGKPTLTLVSTHAHVCNVNR